MNVPKPYRDTRPWGEELWLTKDAGSPSMVKIISVNPGEALSLQYHMNRDEYWAVVSGNGTAEIDGKNTHLEAGVVCFIPRVAKHRVTGGSERLVFVEMTFGAFDEADIVRLEDKYGRATAAGVKLS